VNGHCSSCSLIQLLVEYYGVSAHEATEIDRNRRGDFAIVGPHVVPTWTSQASDIEYAVFLIVYSNVCRKDREFTEKNREIVCPDEFAEIANSYRSDRFTSNRTRGGTSAVVRSDDRLKDFLCGFCFQSFSQMVCGWLQ
jgi:hypothetical protein